MDFGWIFLFMEFVWTGTPEPCLTSFSTTNPAADCMIWAILFVLYVHSSFDYNYERENVWMDLSIPDWVQGDFQGENINP